MPHKAPLATTELEDGELWHVRGCPGVAKSGLGLVLSRLATPAQTVFCTSKLHFWGVPHNSVSPPKASLASKQERFLGCLGTLVE